MEISGEINRRIVNRINELGESEETKELLLELLDYETTSREGPGIRWKEDYGRVIKKYLKES